MTQAALRNGSSVQIQQSDVCVVTLCLNSETNDNVSSLPEVHCYRPGWTVSEAQAGMVKTKSNAVQVNLTKTCPPSQIS